MTAPHQFYADTAAAAARDESRHRGAMERLSAGRLGAALLAALAAFAAMRASEPAGRQTWWLAAGALALVFVALIVLHRRAGSRHDLCRRRRIAAQSGAARVAREWAAMPPVRWTPPIGAAAQALARDLDVTGDVSLHRLLDVGVPALGGARALGWVLADPPPVADIEARAASVAALRGDAETLLAFAAAAVTNRRVLTRGVEQFVGWLGVSGGGGDARVPSVLAAASALTAATMTALVALRPGLAAVVPLLAAVQVVIAVVARRHLHRELAGVGDALAQLDEAVQVMERVTALRDVPGRFGEVQAQLRGDHAVPALAGLRRLLDWNNIRYTPLAHWLLNASVGLDVYIWRGVRAWRAAHRAQGARWLADAADADALVALATLGFDNPTWAAARVHDDDAAPPLEARALGHPLLSPATVVRNDLVLARRGAVTVVSGSNMAGKTTYLRAAGLATLLAQAGGPVCATQLAVRRCIVRTSVRVEDNLAGGVSLFMAEAMRLAAIVGEAEGGGGRPPVLFLLDEILHGTNAHDRREATRLVLRRLAAAGASGLVTTHDPTIADAGGRQLHFREHVSPEGSTFRMTFDYTAREGPATTTNALAVMRMLGLTTE